MRENWKVFFEKKGLSASGYVSMVVWILFLLLIIYTVSSE